jgi:hypothetical protein
MVGILLLAGGVYLLWEDRGYPSELTVTGKLTGSYPAPAWRRRPSGTNYVFEYVTPDGRQTGGPFRVSRHDSVQRDGDTVTVLYRPDAPAQARLVVTHGGVEFVPWGLGAIALLGGLRVIVLELLKRRRRRLAVRSQAVPGA